MHSSRSFRGGPRAIRIHGRREPHTDSEGRPGCPKRPESRLGNVKYTNQSIDGEKAMAERCALAAAEAIDKAGEVGGVASGPGAIADLVLHIDDGMN